MIVFDTHKLVTKLKESGIPENQAEVFTDAFKEVQETGFENLVTKHELKEVKQELQQDIKEVKQELQYEIKLLRWMMGFTFAGVLSLVVKAFF